MTKSELEAMTKDELVAYADDHDIEVHHHWVKDDIITEIMKAERKAAKQEAKQEEHPAAQPVAQSGAEPAAAPYPEVDPKLAELQKLAQKLPE